MADEIVAVYRAEVEQYKKAVDELVGKVNALDKEQKKAGDTANKMGAVFKGLGREIIAAFGVTAGIAGFVNVVRGAIKISADFEAQMSKVRAVSGATGKEMAALEKTAKQLGASTMFTATQVGQLQEEFAKLGFTTEQIQQATAATLDLAAATGSTLAQAAEVAGATVQGFGLDAAETVRVTDVMAQSFNRSALDIERFRESIKLVAPIARAANIDLETTTALLGELANAGLSGSIAGTALKNLLSKLSDENSDLSKQLGFAVKNSDDLFVAFDKLAKMNIDLTEATELTDERSKAAFITLFNGIDTVKDLDSALRDAAGSTKEMARIMQDNLQGSLTILSSAYEGFVLKLMEGNGLLKTSVDAIASGLSKYTEAMVLTEQTGFKALDVALLLITANGKLKEAQEAATAASAENAKQLALDNAEILKALGTTVERIEEVANSVRSIASLNEQIKNLKDELSNAEIGSRAFFDTFTKVEAKTKELEAAIRSLRMSMVPDAGLTLLDPKTINQIADVSLKSLNQALTLAKQRKDEAFEFTPAFDKAVAEIDRLEKRIKEFGDTQIEVGADVKANVVENVQEQAQITQDAYDENLANAEMFFGQLLEINNAITSAIMAGHEQERISLDNQLEAGQISREQYDQRRRQLEREKAQDAKTAALFNAVIGTALAVVNALAVGPPQGYILAALSAALGAVEIGVIASQPLPQYAKGVIGLQGAGTETSDSIHARLSKGESVMTAAETKKYRPLLEGMRNGTLGDIIRETYVRPAIDAAMLSGFADMGRSAELNGLTAKLSDHNIIAAMDRNRSATVYGLKMLADKLDKRTQKRGGYA
jgi:TP901 family phage tail tape measure protein